MADIDIDCADRNKIINLIKCTPAIITHGGKTRIHNSGVYVTDIPSDPYTRAASIHYQEAEQRGYFKIDLLNMSVYQMIQNQDHYDQMLAQEPQWNRLWEQSGFCQQIVHIGNYFALLKSMKPDSLIKMAAFISIIRPGKANLQNQDWETVLNKVWDGNSDDGYVFRKSHAISYAMLVKLHINLVVDSGHLSDQDNRASF